MGLSCPGRCRASVHSCGDSGIASGLAAHTSGLAQRCRLPHWQPHRAPFPGLGTSRRKEGLRQCCCPMPQQGQGATASVLAGLRLCPVPKWGFCFVSKNNGEEATLCMAAWAQFLAFGSHSLYAGRLCRPSVSVASKCRQAEQ